MTRPVDGRLASMLLEVGYTEGKAMIFHEEPRSHVVKWLLIAATVGACLLASTTAPAETYVEVRIAPPVARVEVVPTRPSPRHVWVRGYWGWDGYHHLWVPGHYVVARHGYTYVEPHWRPAGRGHWRFHRGGWQRR